LGARDYEQAREWYKRAAEHGCSNAQNQLGYMAQLGLGEETNYVQALDWYYKAAAQGNSNAQENIGYLYQHGLGVDTDYEQAEAWYYKAAGQGNSNAENQLGYLNQYGLGIPPDFAEALAWYRTAADQGNKTAIENLKSLSERLQGVDAELWKAASTAAQQAGDAQAARRARIANLQRQIIDLEIDAQLEDNLAEPANASAPSTMGAATLRKEADMYRTEAARLRAQVAGLDVLAASSATAQ
jgi:TPR repeat protein